VCKYASSVPSKNRRRRGREKNFPSEKHYGENRAYDAANQGVVVSEELFERLTHRFYCAVFATGS
jgi:hypothetical protein